MVGNITFSIKIHAIRLVAERLKALRKERGLLQVEVVKNTGMNIGRIEAAMVNISVSSIDKLCRYYGVTLEEFFNRLDF